MRGGKRTFGKFFFFFGSSRTIPPPGPGGALLPGTPQWLVLSSWGPLNEDLTPLPANSQESSCNQGGVVVGPSRQEAPGLDETPEK